MIQLLCQVGLLPPAHASDAGVGPESLRVTIVAGPWEAPFTADDLASALRLRLPRAEVIVADAASPGDRSQQSVTVRWLAEPRGLRMERGSGDAAEFPLTGGGDPAQATRRAALVIALFADEGARLGDAPARVHAPPVAGANSPAGAAPLVETPAAASPPAVTSPPQRPPPAGWALSAQVGFALAVQDDGISSTESLTLRARRYVRNSTAVELGARLSGEYTHVVGSQQVGVADHAFFAGLAYEAWLSRRLAVDLSVGLQYTQPVVDVDGDGPASHLHAPSSTRLAVRTGVGLVWSPGEHLTTGVSAATSFSFREREYVDDAGREALDLGSMIVDLTVGAGVRW